MPTDHITYDAAYDTVAPDDFPAMMAVPRYGRRSNAFDTIISQTHDHFWDPLDKAYIDFDVPFDIDRQLIMPENQTLELNCAVVDKVPADKRIRFANDLMQFSMSSILHGEQGALSLSASLCHILLDPGGQEYAANQARGEGRHVARFTKYVAARWGEPLPVGPTLGNLLTELVTAQEVYKKIVGMQMLVEGLAMGAFATINAKTNDPTLRRLIQLVMSDEACHHRLGRIWAKKRIRHVTQEERSMVGIW